MARIFAPWQPCGRSEKAVRLDLLTVYWSLFFITSSTSQYGSAPKLREKKNAPAIRRGVPQGTVLDAFHLQKNLRRTVRLHSADGISRPYLGRKNREICCHAQLT